MADWDADEARYLNNPEEYIENLGKELNEQREIQRRRDATLKEEFQWIRPKIGVKRNYDEKLQRGFHHPPKAAKRPASTWNSSHKPQFS